MNNRVGTLRLYFSIPHSALCVNLFISFTGVKKIANTVGEKLQVAKMKQNVQSAMQSQLADIIQEVNIGGYLCCRTGTKGSICLLSM